MDIITPKPVPFEGSTVEELAAAYVKMRDTKLAIQHAADAKIEPIEDALKQIKVALSDRLKAVGAESIRTKAGTVFRSVKRFTNVGDWASFHEYLWENKRFDLLQRRVNNPGVISIVEDTGVIPPGCVIVSEEEINIRKS
jgi:hypothetical protein